MNDPMADIRSAAAGVKSAASAMLLLYERSPWYHEVHWYTRRKRRAEIAQAERLRVRRYEASRALFNAARELVDEPASSAALELMIESQHRVEDLLWQPQAVTP